MAPSGLRIFLKVVMSYRCVYCVYTKEKTTACYFYYNPPPPEHTARDIRAKNKYGSKFVFYLPAIRRAGNVPTTHIKANLIWSGVLYISTKITAVYMLCTIDKNQNYTDCAISRDCIHRRVIKSCVVCMPFCTRALRRGSSGTALRRQPYGVQPLPLRSSYTHEQHRPSNTAHAFYLNAVSPQTTCD